MTPRTFRLLTRSMFIDGWGRSAELPLLPRAAKMISFDLEQFSFKLFVAAHAWTRVISCSRELGLTTGTTKYVSSANKKMRLSVVSGWRSAAVTIYEAGPRLEPWMTLALISATNEHLPAYLVQTFTVILNRDHWNWQKQILIDRCYRRRLHYRCPHCFYCMQSLGQPRGEFLWWL